MRLINRILIVGVVLCISAVAASTAGAYNIRGSHVSASLVGAISAAPCDRTDICSFGVVEVDRVGDHTASSVHLVKCMHPKRLSVVAATRRHVWVYACGSTHQWRMPR